MEKIMFEDAALTSQAKVTIDGVDHLVTEAEYSGGTDLNARTFNLLQDNVENAISEVENAISEVEDVISEIDKNIYSYEEQRVGTWIDGRPLYRRVFAGGFDGKTNKILTDVLPTTCEIKRADGITLQVDGVERPLTFYFVYQGVEYYTSYMITQNTTKTAHSISFYCSNEYKDLSFIITLEYTKTTD